MRRLFALPALFAIALVVPLLGASSASAENGSGQIILSGPDAVVTQTTATFTFNDTYKNLTCTLDANPVSCAESSPWTTPALALGSHHLAVTGDLVFTSPPVCDPEDPTICTVTPPSYVPFNDQWDWTVVRPATATLTAPTKPFQLGTSATLSWRTTTPTGAPAVSRIELSSRRAGTNGTFGTPTIRAFTPTTTRATATVRSGYTDCFRVRATDASGTTGPWSPERCTAKPLDDRTMTASKGWKRTKSSSAYNSTLITAKSARRTLSRTVARVARVGIVATTCRTCGKVTVKIGAKVIGTVNLRSATTKRRQLLLLPAFTPRTGKLMLTTTSRKMVQIDGVAVSPR